MSFMKDANIQKETFYNDKNLLFCSTFLDILFILVKKTPQLRCFLFLFWLINLVNHVIVSFNYI